MNRDLSSLSNDNPLLITEAQARMRAAELAARPGRTILGIAGAPGAGKSTLAAALAGATSGSVLVPMDGFHLPTTRLAELGRVETRGAPDTFDADGYVALLRAIRAGDDLRAPGFDRTIEEPVPDAIAVAAGCPLVITEGNYLLLWPAVRPLLDECWYVDVDETVRIERLVARFVFYGWDAAAARHRVTHGSDAANARIVAATRARADRLVTPLPSEWSLPSPPQRPSGR